MNLRSTITGIEYPFERLEEFAENGEALEVVFPAMKKARILPGKSVWERFSDFFPFEKMNSHLSLGEGDTPLLAAGKRLQELTGIRNLLLKDETRNPTWSFKDRGSLSCICMAQALGENVTATISTGNMGHSLAAYAARAGLAAIVFVPHYAPVEKIAPMALHGAHIFKVQAPDYSMMKREILHMAGKFRLRIVTGNGPLRVEGYKSSAFELFEQLGGRIPDYVAIPTSACGHVRGIFKGFLELREANLINRLPKMIIVQAANCSPVVSAIKQGKKEPIPFRHVQTVAEAISGGDPPGGEEIVLKSQQYGWLAEDASEEEIMEGQHELARSGFFVEPASATPLFAVKKLNSAGKIGPKDTVVLMLTGSGLKDSSVFQRHPYSIFASDLEGLPATLDKVVKKNVR